MKRTIEIECPDGHKPIYNAETGSIEMVPEISSIEMISKTIDRIKTYEDAINYLGNNVNYYNDSVNSIAKLQIILDALNEGHKFDLLTGTVWHPCVRFFKTESVPEGAEIIGHFRYQDKKFALVGGSVYFGGNTGISRFLSYYAVSYVYDGILACKSKEIAKYVSTQFGKLIFEACFARHFEDKEFEWLD